jgi:polyhydroxyalkanoate synthase subunit PhaC
MSWNAGQPFTAPQGVFSAPRAPRPLAAMAAAVLAASHKPLVEEALRQAAATMHNVPPDINWADFQTGISRYQNASFTYARPSYPVLAHNGRVSLLNAGGEAINGTLVIIPSMVNKGYVLDLYPGHSMVEAMRNGGYNVLLIDWGDPALLTDAPLTFEQIIAERLLPLLHAAHAHTGSKIDVFGYCMGGLIALAGSILAGPEVVRKLAVAAMPWDFSVTPSTGHMQASRHVLEGYLATPSIVPPDAMQSYFWLLDPWSPVRRLMALGKEPDETRLHFLLTLEDWLADGLALDSPVVAEMLLGWYADNRTLKGTWQVAGQTITPAALKVPLWLCITQHDVLVPTACSLPAAGQSNSATIHTAATGHVGLVCGRKAQAQLYAPLLSWLRGA